MQAPPIAVPPIAVPSEADIQRQLLLQTVNQERLLGQIERAEGIAAYSAVQTGRDVRVERQIDQFRFYLFLAVIAGIAIFLIATWASLSSRYAYMISKVSAATRSGIYKGPSGLFIAVAYEYPFLAGLRLNNQAFAVAAVNAYYTKEFYAYMNNDFYGFSFLEQMYNFATKGFDTTSSDKPNAQSILCTIIANGVTPPIPERACNSPCPGPTSLGWTDYASSAIATGTQFAFLGGMAGGGAFSIPFAAGGFIVGGLIGAGLRLFGQSSGSSKCGNQSQCITSEGTVRVCGS
ncbi:hypothetical protein ml_448 [Mollivirus sibericum]|uniref:hypothetical protein n=1 Tax=Mollivirus sibericum TaxID=1678078 RepID=UPI0006B2E96C|nr:hypothetical protein ml_448 [Mollivirus sibericum]ALD62250.1 hypothetical protein ml_448 [Mollivirus sibericum]